MVHSIINPALKMTRGADLRSNRSSDCESRIIGQSLHFLVIFVQDHRPVFYLWLTMKLPLAVTLAFFASSATAEVPSLTPDNYDMLTGGKAVFIKFFAPWYATPVAICSLIHVSPCEAR